MRAGSEPFTLEKQGTNWWVISPRRFLADGPWVRETFQRFMRLRIEDFLDDLGTNPGRYGLDQPAREYSFYLGKSNGSPALLTRLTMGTPLGEGGGSRCVGPMNLGFTALPQEICKSCPCRPHNSETGTSIPATLSKSRFVNRGARGCSGGILWADGMA